MVLINTMITDRQLENAWQEKLDSISRVNEPDEFECQSCGQMKPEDDACDHDWYTEHQWCQGCCDDSDYERENREPHMDWNDLD